MPTLLPRLATIAALGLAVPAAPAAAQDALELDTVVATVNGSEITLGHMMVARSTLPDRFQELEADVLWQGILDQMVRQEVLAQSESAQDTARVRLSVENERRVQMATSAIETLAEDAVTEETLRAAYAEQYTDGESVEYNASHILVETLEEAEAVFEALEGGADFADLARANSTGPSGPNGGSLGWFGAGMMVAPFQAAVEELRPGQFSMPVQTQFGWHVILLNETRVPEAPAFEDVRDQLQEEIANRTVTDFLESALNSAVITRMGAGEVDTSVLSDMTLLEE